MGPAGGVAFGIEIDSCARCGGKLKNVDFDLRQSVVRDGKGHKDRVTVLPDAAVDPRHSFAMHLLDAGL